ncbi:sigma-70 family RNA polymerase sigma factor [Gracilibacillus kekensis]|uniref:RNA polymerase sigma factor, sigma-70 family n=1 Tax=Gracilibacillus kekensis TaxID=1027249 RepID=A0A1M7JWK9_9BACI|nr:sigma-70 family RNA polymerase sigma factor [Gracilibacillus kekensis]SHM57374.1 RNA polymerase sigma factor, sigma-70 family [Gracilibacillus kekensis]
MQSIESVLQEYDRMIHHLIHKYKIRDTEGDFFQEGLIAIWHAYQTYDESKSKFSTYVYYCIARRFLNKIQKDNRENDQLQSWLNQITTDDFVTEMELDVDTQMLTDIQKVLSQKQWCWFVEFILRDQAVQDIAEKYEVTNNAVKNWGKLARPKIQQVLRVKEYVE